MKRDDCKAKKLITFFKDAKLHLFDNPKRLMQNATKKASNFSFTQSAPIITLSNLWKQLLYIISWIDLWTVFGSLVYCRLQNELFTLPVSSWLHCTLVVFVRMCPDDEGEEQGVAKGPIDHQQTAQLPHAMTSKGGQKSSFVPWFKRGSKKTKQRLANPKTHHNETEEEVASIRWSTWGDSFQETMLCLARTKRKDITHLLSAMNSSWDFDLWAFTSSSTPHP